MAHEHGHGHEHGIDYDRAFAIGVGLNVAYVVVEVAFGLVANSLALLADAGHNVSDVLSLLLAWGAHRLSKLRPTDRYTYGYRSSSILAALLNAVILLVAVGAIAWEAIRRFGAPPTPATATMMWVAGAGVLINGLTAALFTRGQHDLNVRGAFLHMAADAGVSLGVVLAGLAIHVTGEAWIDPAVGLVVAAVILWGTWGLLRESLELALQAVPAGIDPHAVREYLAGLPGVAEVHDLHIWGMSTTETALTAHLVKPDPADDDEFLARTTQHLHDEFGIGHATIQIERGNGEAPCPQAPPDAV